jgi:hypothetical protein
MKKEKYFQKPEGCIQWAVMIIGGGFFLSVTIIMIYAYISNCIEAKHYYKEGLKSTATVYKVIEGKHRTVYYHYEYTDSTYYNFEWSGYNTGDTFSVYFLKNDPADCHTQGFIDKYYLN